MEYWAMYRAVCDMLDAHDLCGNDTFINDCVQRIWHDADSEWNSDDVRIAIRNALNELIENFS